MNSGKGPVYAVRCLGNGTVRDSTRGRLEHLFSDSHTLVFFLFSVPPAGLDQRESHASTRVRLLRLLWSFSSSLSALLVVCRWLRTRIRTRRRSVCSRRPTSRRRSTRRMRWRASSTRCSAASTPASTRTGSSSRTTTRRSGNARRTLEERTLLQAGIGRGTGFDSYRIHGAMALQQI
jgi:hypothetical protein